MALSDLISRLEQEAQSEVWAIEQRTAAEVLAIEQATETAAEEAIARYCQERRAERQAGHQRELAEARRQARARELEASHALLARILERARTLIPETGASDLYRGALTSHLEEALSYLEGLPANVRCQAVFAPVLQPRLASRQEATTLGLDESVGPGLIAEAADGSVVVDNTLAARLSRIQSQLAIDLLGEVRDGRP